MASPKLKGEVLSEGTKGYIEELFLEREYGIRKTFWSRYTDKGNEVEKESIRLANRVLNWGLTEEYINREKQEYFSNDWVIGHTDVCTDWLLADVKSSWSGTTFKWFKNQKISKDYYYQLQGYMWLTGHEQAELAYCLVDTPQKLILDEIRREHWKQDSVWKGDEDDEIVDFVIQNHTFGRIPEKVRVKNFVIPKDNDCIEAIKQRILLVREYYNELKLEHSEN